MTKKILIVDNEQNLVISLEFLMKQAGYHSEVAHDGEEALQKLAEFQPDLILLDVMLPKLNGFELCQRIRANPAYQSVKIVMLTAKGRKVEVTKGLELGADHYLIKPFSIKTLMTRIKQLVEENGPSTN